jgi:hypothetical protein
VVDVGIADQLVFTGDARILYIQFETSESIAPPALVEAACKTCFVSSSILSPSGFSFSIEFVCYSQSIFHRQNKNNKPSYRG